jgi:hypothetical protein
MELYSEATDSDSEDVLETDVVTEATLFGRINLLIHKLDQVISSTQEISLNLTQTNLNSDTDNLKGNNNFVILYTKVHREPLFPSI